MRDFEKKKNYGGKNKNYGAKKSYGGGGYGAKKSYGAGSKPARPAMHRATCNDCGNSCEVPFRPTGNKPIYCSNCFRGKEGNNSSDSRGKGRGNFGDRNSKPSFGNKKPYQSGKDSYSPNYKADFEMLNKKLDRIIKALAPQDFQEKYEAPVKKKKKESIISFDESTTAEEKKKKTTKKPSPKKKASKKAVVKKKVVKKKKK